MIIIRFLVSIFTILLLVNNSYSQRAQDIDNRIIDSILFTNDLLINGRYYFESNPNASGTSYFLSDDWQKGWLSLMGVKFENVEYKLDLIEDKLVLNNKKSNYNEIAIELNPVLVDSFKIEEHIFLSNKSLKLDRNFVELIYNSQQLELYKTHQKFFKKIYDSNTPYGQISEKISDKYLCMEDRLINVNKKRDLLETQPKAKRKKIKVFLNKNNIKYKRATNDELKQLMKFYEEL